MTRPRMCPHHGRPRQLELNITTWGGRRAGAGRKRAKKNFGLLVHRARPEFVARVPVHATMRTVRGVPSLRAQLVARHVFDEIGRASAKGFRLIHFSVQEDHVHVIAEGDDATCFSRGMQRLASRIARVVNAVARRRGTFWRERYHRRDLATPRQFRNALVYVTMNFRKHSRSADRAMRARGIDALSSGIWFEDWASEDFAAYVREQRERMGYGRLRPPVVRPTTWIARVGWKKHGKLDPRESPRSPG